jgi:cystine transport system substrate-binding protein
MIFSKIRRQWLLSIMAVALTAGMSINSYAADNLSDKVNLLDKVKQRGTLIIG